MVAYWRAAFLYIEWLLFPASCTKSKTTQSLRFLYYHVDFKLNGRVRSSCNRLYCVTLLHYSNM